MANKTYHPLKAPWRLFTEEQLKALPPTPEAAFKVDSIYYYTNQACPKNHIAARYTQSRCCVVCQADKTKSITKPTVKTQTDNTESTIVFGIKINTPLDKNKE